MLTEDLILVDRSIVPTLPHHAAYCKIEMLHPELQTSGPAKINLHNLEFHSGPYPEIGRSGWVKGSYIYEYIIEHSLIERCLNSRDAEEIRNMGTEIFSRYFGNKRVPIWKSALGGSRGTPQEVQILQRNRRSKQPSLYYESLENFYFWSDALVLYK